MNSSIQCVSFKKLLLTFCLFACLIGFYISGNAQENPPKPFNVTVVTLQNLNFGTFCYSNTTGEVIVNAQGVRSITGDIILLSSSTSAALYDIEAIEGTLITILPGPPVNLPGSATGFLKLSVGASDPVSPFIVKLAAGTATGVDKMVRMRVSIGGTLTVGVKTANPPGIYGGTFNVTFIQQ